MSFIRTKIIKGNHYLYEVENNRVGATVVQKVRKYLGKASQQMVRHSSKKVRHYTTHPH